MRIHVLSNLSGAVLAFEQSNAHRRADYSSFVATNEQTCHEIDIEPELLGLVGSGGSRLISRLRVVVEQGTAKLVY